jgi:3-dehydroquinate synthase
LAQLPLNRNQSLAAVGGGVVGDLGGFVAATYMRGVRYLQVPTTLLAMVDSSVGGKVAIDLDSGKNLVGAFYPPTEVLVAPEFISTLPERQVRNGMAEVWKYAFVLDMSLAQDVASGWNREVIERCIELKRSVVEEDEFDTTGRRAVLNFGHTVGHAIETALAYRDILHGEAIAIGMRLEAMIGERLGITAPGTAEAIAQALGGAGFDLENPCRDATDVLLNLMVRDKKAESRKLAFSLLTELGACKLVNDVPESVVEEVLAQA